TRELCAVVPRLGGKADEDMRLIASGEPVIELGHRATPNHRAELAERSSTLTSDWLRAPVRSTHDLRPAVARAPAGSITERVSSKTSLMAAQISSLVT